MRIGLGVEVGLDEKPKVNFKHDNSSDGGAFSGASEEKKDVFDG